MPARTDTNLFVPMTKEQQATHDEYQYQVSMLVNLDLPPWNPAVLEQCIARIYRLGQENPAQIINMISRGTIEERMLATLKFKSDLAAGILDVGDDAVFLENNKFGRIVEVIYGVINETSESEPAEDSAPKSSPEATASPSEPPTTNPNPADTIKGYSKSASSATTNNPHLCIAAMISETPWPAA